MTTVLLLIVALTILIPSVLPPLAIVFFWLLGNVLWVAWFFFICTCCMVYSILHDAYCSLRGYKHEPS